MIVYLDHIDVLHACYYVDMKAIQYTIRNIPAPIDRHLRKRAAISGQSLNSIIIEELSSSAGVDKQDLTDTLDWFIGGNYIGESEKSALAEDDKIQKNLTRKQ